MRILVMLSLCGLLLAAGISGAYAQAGAEKQKSQAKPTAYACPKCEVASTKPGKCACSAQMVPVSGRIAYVCEHCITEKAWSSPKPGKCPMCGGGLQKVLITYACEGCNVTSAKPGECSKCGGALKKHVVPFKG